jgi:hypothetical protein
MDPLTRINQLTAQVQLVSLPTRQYLGAINRDPLHLPIYRQTLHTLLGDLAQHVHGTVPQGVYAQNIRDTQQLLEQLTALEAGFTAGRGIAAQPRKLQTRDGPNADMREAMQALVDMGCTDRELAYIHGCCERTIGRWRRTLRIFKRAVLNSTPDEVISQVCSVLRLVLLSHTDLPLSSILLQ